MPINDVLLIGAGQYQESLERMIHEHIDGTRVKSIGSYKEALAEAELKQYGLYIIATNHGKIDSEFVALKEFITSLRDIHPIAQIVLLVPAGRYGLKEKAIEWNIGYFNLFPIDEALKQIAAQYAGK